MTVTYEQAYDAVSERLGEKALKHCKRVSKSARRIAEAYGVDADAAALAGLLHDWDRELTGDALMERAYELGIEITPAEEAVPYLLHARTAAADLRLCLPDLPDEVVCAIERHTMGAAEMSDLERVVYIADMIEPKRDFPGVDDLREAVGRVTLSELFVRAYAQTIRSLADRRRPIHPSTVETWNALIAEDTDA